MRRTPPPTNPHPGHPARGAVLPEPYMTDRPMTLDEVVQTAQPDPWLFAVRCRLPASPGPWREPAYAPTARAARAMGGQPFPAPITREERAQGFEGAILITRPGRPSRRMLYGFASDGALDVAWAVSTRVGARALEDYLRESGQVATRREEAGGTVLTMPHCPAAYDAVLLACAGPKISVSITGRTVTVVIDR